MIEWAEKAGLQDNFDMVGAQEESAFVESKRNLGHLAKLRVEADREQYNLDALTLGEG